MSERIRLTITVSPEVHAVFSRMAEAGGLSLGRCMGEWLADTSEGAQFVATKMEEARKAPRVVMREMQAFARGVVDQVDELAESVRSQAGPGPRKRSGTAGGRTVAPPSNTGLNPPSMTRRKRS